MRASSTLHARSAPDLTQPGAPFRVVQVEGFVRAVVVEQRAVVPDRMALSDWAADQFAQRSRFARDGDVHFPRGMHGVVGFGNRRTALDCLDGEVTGSGAIAFD